MKDDTLWYGQGFKLRDGGCIYEKVAERAKQIGGTQFDRGDYALAVKWWIKTGDDPEDKASRCEHTKMEAHPSIVEEAMAVEPTDANESAAAPQGAGSEVLLEDADLESPAKKRKMSCKIICTLMCMFAIVPSLSLIHI